MGRKPKAPPPVRRPTPPPPPPRHVPGHAEACRCEGCVALTSP